MSDIMIHLEILKDHLRDRGFDDNFINNVVAQAQQDINSAISSKQDAAMDEAVDVGVQKGSADFINDLRPSDDAFELETESGRTDFSLPPYPNLHNILKNPKVAADGSLYKVIPVGAPSPPRNIAANIFDAARAMDIERKEQAAAQSRTPRNVKTTFRTASSKQDATNSWVLPAKPMDFTDDLNQINSQLRDNIESTITEIINSYKEAY